MHIEIKKIKNIFHLPLIWMLLFDYECFIWVADKKD